MNSVTSEVTKNLAKDSRPLRFVTAASLFDGHDAAINIMRRLIQATGAEVIHLGHNRSVAEVVSAAIQEDADAIALSSYQGGHLEYFRYVIDMLKQRGAAHISVFGGGGGTITPQEIESLQAYGVARIYHPHDGLNMGLEEMIADVVGRAQAGRQSLSVELHEGNLDEVAIGRFLSALEAGVFDGKTMARFRKSWSLAGNAPVVGITGTGGAGKSSVTDEMLSRIRRHFPEKQVAVIAVDPTRRRSGGALLGDRIRFNSLRQGNIFMRSMATRRQHLATNEILQDCIAFLRSQAFDLVLVETAGIGQSDSEIADLVDFPVYVMTSEYGAASQLEKIDMLDYADLIIVNKFDKRGAEDALRDVKKQWRRNHNNFDLADADIPVYPCIASQFNDPGADRVFAAMIRGFSAATACSSDWKMAQEMTDIAPTFSALIPPSRQRYLSDISDLGRACNREAQSDAALAASLQHAYEALKLLGDPLLPVHFEAYEACSVVNEEAIEYLPLRRKYNQLLKTLGAANITLLGDWPARAAAGAEQTHSYQVRGKEVSGPNYVRSLSHLDIPRVAIPEFHSWGEQLRFLQLENLPGAYPYTAGVFPYRRQGEEPTRMFAGEGTPERTNRRFHYVSKDSPAKRLSTAFDSVTLYGEDPHERPDIYGKVGNAGVSIATVDDIKKLYSGFDLCSAATSVSMTINGPAPIILAFFMNAAIDQQVEKYLREQGRPIKAVRCALSYAGELPSGSNGLGLATLGFSGDQLVDQETYERIKADTFRRVRGTVQADILKEDQAQNTCIFSTGFAMRMMADVQHFFIDNQIKNYYSVSISGYHIAEAGANPISQLAFTLSNGFTLVEYYLSRGMKVDDFAPNLSFFFSNGMDAEYSVIGRVARRIWARAMRERYQASERSQKLKYHIQTSGRSLHAQEMQFNDIRTTLQGLYAIFDNCNSLHTNAYDEAITTPTEESVRRAVAIQLIINRELGLNFCENPWQGSFIIEKLTDMVEEAVYAEFDRISDRGGVLGAMDTMYQRGKIQDESMYYEQQKHDGSLPLIGVNTYLAESGNVSATASELMRSTDNEKQSQIEQLAAFHAHHKDQSAPALKKLRQVATSNGNIFAELMETTKDCSLGQIAGALYDVGGEYRRNM